MKIGVISDTHNYLDPAALKLLAGVDHILHGGDVGQGGIIRELEEIAPVTAVLGNTDDPGFGYPLFADVSLGGHVFLLHHIVQPLRLSADLERRIQHLHPSAVIFGHTHKPYLQEHGGVTFFNPGYAGKPRFALARSIGFITIEKAGLSARTVLLPQ